MNCKFCGCDLPDGRPYDYCIAPDCYRQGFEKASYVVIGQHKGPPLVCNPNDPIVTAKVSYMRRG